MKNEIRGSFAAVDIDVRGHLDNGKRRQPDHVERPYHVERLDHVERPDRVERLDHVERPVRVTAYKNENR